METTKPRFAAGAVLKPVAIPYRDEWQREGLVDTWAKVSWVYQVPSGTSSATPEVHYMRWVRVHGVWTYVPKYVDALNGTFTPLMLEAEKKAAASIRKRYVRHSQHAKAAWAAMMVDGVSIN